MTTKSLVAQTITCQTAACDQDITFSDVRNAIAGVISAAQTAISTRPLTAKAAYYSADASLNGDAASDIVGFNPYHQSVDVKSFSAANQLTVTLTFASEQDTLHPNDQNLRVLLFYRKGVNKLVVTVNAQSPVKDVSKAYIEAIYTSICLLLPDMNTIKREEMKIS